MNEREQEWFEAELRRLRPARVPDELASRLSTPPPAPEFASRRRARILPTDSGSWLRWLAPATALALTLLIVLSQVNRGRKSGLPATAAPVAGLKADQVEVDRQWLGSFDAVADMPDGEPVRFRFQQWIDAVTLRDSVRGVEVVQRVPRIEVVPVSFATY